LTLRAYANVRVNAQRQIYVAVSHQLLSHLWSDTGPGQVCAESVTLRAKVKKPSSVVLIRDASHFLIASEHHGCFFRPTAGPAIGILAGRVCPAT